MFNRTYACLVVRDCATSVNSNCYPDTITQDSSWLSSTYCASCARALSQEVSMASPGSPGLTATSCLSLYTASFTTAAQHHHM